MVKSDRFAVLLVDFGAAAKRLGDAYDSLEKKALVCELRAILTKLDEIVESEMVAAGWLKSQG